MNYQETIDSLSPEMYQRLRQALETGKWPDGRPLTAQQKEDTMQAIIAWGEKHLSPEERIGYIDRGHKADEICDDPEETPLNWQE